MKNSQTSTKINLIKNNKPKITINNSINNTRIFRTKKPNNNKNKKSKKKNHWIPKKIIRKSKLKSKVSSKFNPSKRKIKGIPNKILKFKNNYNRNSNTTVQESEIKGKYL